MKFKCIKTSWTDSEAEITAIRTTVFIKEQSVPEELEWDGLDKQAIHLLAMTDNNTAIATLRLLDDGHIGRVAVLKDYRQQGIATALMQMAEEIAIKRNYRELILDAQTYIVSMYENLGFKIEGKEFMDAGIPHLRMRKELIP